MADENDSFQVVHPDMHLINTPPTDLAREQIHTMLMQEAVVQAIETDQMILLNGVPAPIGHVNRIWNQLSTGEKWSFLIPNPAFWGALISGAMDIDRENGHRSEQLLEVPGMLENGFPVTYVIHYEYVGKKLDTIRVIPDIQSQSKNTSSPLPPSLVFGVHTEKRVQYVNGMEILLQASTRDAAAIHESIRSLLMTFLPGYGDNVSCSIAVDLTPASGPVIHVKNRYTRQAESLGFSAQEGGFITPDHIKGNEPELTIADAATLFHAIFQTIPLANIKRG